MHIENCPVCGALALDEKTADALGQLAELFATQPYKEVGLSMYPATDRDEAAAYLVAMVRQTPGMDSQVWGVYSKAESTPEGEIDGSTYVEHAVSSAITGCGPRSEYHARLYSILHNLTPWLLRYVGMASTAVAFDGEGA